MSPEILYARHALLFEDDEDYQKFGDFKFYSNGAATLGPTAFVRGVPIHGYRFGANLIASRHINQPNLLEIDLPFGGRLRFLYRPWLRKWYQLVAIDDPQLYFHQERYGTATALAFYYLRCGVRWAVVEVVQVLFVALAIGALVLLAGLF